MILFSVCFAIAYRTDMLISSVILFLAIEATGLVWMRCNIMIN